MANSVIHSSHSPAPLLLLLRVNSLQIWRRLKSVRQQSRLLTSVIALFIVGWIFQFVGHSVYEKRQPAFLTNAMHLLVGPLWILNDIVHVVKA